MSALVQTLGELLLKTTAEAKAVLEHPGMKDVRSRLALQTTVAWPALTDAFAQALRSALDVKLVDVLIGGWTKLIQLQAYLDRDRYPPTELCLLPLAQHTISSVHHPSVEILLNEQVIERITFHVEFVLTLEGIVLNIRDGRIVAVGAGTCAGGGILKFVDITLCEIQTPKYQIPGTLDLREGIVIPRVW